ncbi:hypothetical protein WS9_015655 [Paraclostridium sordellii 8483]|nr:hypothetical protein WS9_015655 [Paeniclostridium sordellii 8483]
MGDSFDFNLTVKPGRYSIGSGTTLPGSPFPNSIYGNLIVLPRRGSEVQQVFISTDGTIFSRFFDYLGSWSDWYKIPKLNDFEGKNSRTNGYQKLPSGVIIQWGTAELTFDNNRAKGYLYYPISFTNYCHCCGNTGANSYGAFGESTGTVTGDNLSRGYAEAQDVTGSNRNGATVRIQWIAIGI